MHSIQKLVALSFVLLTAACGPMYDTTYQYIPPHSSEGKICLSSCSALKQSCKNNCATQTNMCITNNNIRRLAAHAAKDRQYYEQYCDDYSCRSECDTEYNHCYQNCGGQIIPHTRCVYNCDKAR